MSEGSKRSQHRSTSVDKSTGVGSKIDEIPTNPVGASWAAQGSSSVAAMFADFGKPQHEVPPYVWKEAPGIDPLTKPLSNQLLFVLFFARSGVGKSFFAEYIAEKAILAGMTPIFADFDRENASLSARFGVGNVVRPLNADDASFEAGLKKLLEFQKACQQHVLLDIGMASARIFCEIAARIHLQAIQERNGIRPVVVIPLGPRKDDWMLTEKLSGAYLPRDVLLVPNCSLVPPGKDRWQTFEPVLTDPRARGLIARGARTMWMPALPSGTEFHNTKRPFDWAARMDWDNPLDEFEQGAAEDFLRDMCLACQKNADILPFPI